MMLEMIMVESDPRRRTFNFIDCLDPWDSCVLC